MRFYKHMWVAQMQGSFFKFHLKFTPPPSEVVGCLPEFFKVIPEKRLGNLRKTVEDGDVGKQWKYFDIILVVFF